MKKQVLFWQCKAMGLCDSHIILSKELHNFYNVLFYFVLYLAVIGALYVTMSVCMFVCWSDGRLRVLQKFYTVVNVLTLFSRGGDLAIFERETVSEGGKSGM